MFAWVFRRRSLSCPVLFVAALTACGGGGGGGDDGGSTTTLSGVAAGGAAVVGQVTVKGSAGNTRTALIEANGHYEVDVDGLTPPYILRAKGTVGGRTVEYHSYAVAADATSGTTVNITAFTDLILANAAQQLAATVFDNGTVGDIPEAEIAAQEAALQTKLQAVLTAAGVDAAVDLLHTAFNADHSGLDLVLDIVRVEVDTATNVATLTNFLDNTSITDNLTDTSDNAAALTVTSDLTATQTNFEAIVSVFDSLTTLFADGLPTTAQLSPLLADDLLDYDQGKSQFMTDVTTDPDVIGIAFVNISIDAIDQTPGAETATVTFRVTFDGVLEPESETWAMAKNNGAWQIRGNRSIVDNWVDFACARSIGANGVADGGVCGINVGIDDLDDTNNGAGNGIIASAHAMLHRNGAPVAGSDIFLGVPQFGAAGELRIFDSDFSDDFMAFGQGSGQIDPALFHAGDVLTAELFTTDLVPTPAVTGTAVGSVSLPILAAPHTNPATAPYPAATAATITAFESYAGGNLNIGWTLADGTTSDEVWLEICDTSSCVRINDEQLGAASTSQTLALDLSSLDSTAASYTAELRIYARDTDGQFYLTSYLRTIAGPGANNGGGNPAPTLTCDTVSGWDDTADGGLGAPITPYSYADFEAIVADCGAGLGFSTALVSGKTYVSSDGLESSTFSADGTGVFNEVGESPITFNWAIENIGGFDRLVLSATVDVGGGQMVSFRDTHALIAVAGDGSTVTIKAYSEQSNFSDMVRDTGADGDVWQDVLTVQ